MKLHWIRILLLAVSLPAVAADEIVASYDWLTQGQVSGQLELTIHEPGMRSARFEFNDRGRGPKLAERYAVDDKGLITVYEVRGHAYMGAPVAERFLHADGAAEWESTLESGNREAPLNAFYLANDGTPEQMAALARALLAAPDQRLGLLPLGEARIERLAAEEVTIKDRTRRVELYAIHGLGFGPSHLWLDEDRELFALALGWMGLVPSGGAEVLPQLEARQQTAARAAQKKLAAELTHELPGAYCLSGFSVLDVDAGQLLPGATVRVEEGRIAGIGGGGAVDCAGIPVIEGGGRTLMPGLWDMHVHIRMEQGPLHIAAGVTSVRDLGNDHQRLIEAIEHFDKGEAIGPTVYRAGFIDARGPFAAPTGNLAGSLEEALAFIGKLDEQGYRHIKIYSSIRPDWVAPMAAEMQRRSITLSGHIPSGMSAAEAVAAGFDEIQHINMLFLNFLAGPGDDTRTPLRFSLVAERGAELDLESEEVAAFIELLKQRGTVVDPTVAIFDNMFRHRSGEVSPSYAMIADHLPPSVRRSMLSGMMDINDDNAGRYAASASALLDMIRKLHESGIGLVAGTDALAGFTLHRELELYAEAGIPNADVLRIVTIGSARVAGENHRFGRIAPGYTADLIVVDGNPLEDIGALRNTVMTLKATRLYQASALHRALGIAPFTSPLELSEYGETAP